MSLIEEYFFMLIASFIMGIIVYVIVPAKNRISPLKLTLSIFLLFSSTIVSSSFSHLGFRVLLLLLTLSVLVKIFYSFSLIMSIILSIASYFLYVVGDIVASIIVINGLGVNYLTVRQDFTLSLLSHGIICAMSLLLTLLISLIRKYGNRLKEIFRLPMIEVNFRTVFFIYLLITILIISIFGELHINIVLHGENRMVILIACAIIVYFLISLAVIYFYNIALKEKFKSEEKEREYKQLIIYTEVIEGLIKNLRTYQHNYINTLASIRGYVEQGEYEALKKYLVEEVFEDTKMLKGKDAFSPLQKISNPGIKGLVATKINSAINNNIQFNVEVLEDIDFTPYCIETIDICKIIGILLDNAIEAAMESEKKNISLLITRNEQDVSIVVTNTFKNPPDINKMFNYGYSTKGKNRGIGLSIVKDILNTKYPNLLLNTIIEKDTFIAELIICKP